MLKGEESGMKMTGRMEEKERRRNIWPSNKNQQLSALRVNKRDSRTFLEILSIQFCLSASNLQRLSPSLFELSGILSFERKLILALNKSSSSLLNLFLLAQHRWSQIKLIKCLKNHFWIACLHCTSTLLFFFVPAHYPLLEIAMSFIY